MSPEETGYYRERAQQERAKANKSARKDVAEIHEELARLYEALIEVDAGSQPFIWLLINRLRFRPPFSLSVACETI